MERPPQQFVVVSTGVLYSKIVMARPYLVKLLSVLVIAAGAIALFLMRSPVSSADGHLAKLTEAWQALDEASQWTVSSLDPGPPKLRPPGGKVIQGYDVLGEITVSSREVRQHIQKELRQAVLASDGPPMMCFNPRHAIQVRQAGKVIDILICFECNAVHAYTDNVMTEAAALQGSPDYLSGLLQAAGIPIAP